MLRYASRYWRRNRHSAITYLSLSIFSALLTGLVLLAHIGFSGIVAFVSGVPEEIVRDSLDNNVGGVLLFGDYEMRHNFAKGLPTEHGAMPYDTEERLMGAPYYWSYEEVHKKGFLLGFSDLP